MSEKVNKKIEVYEDRQTKPSSSNERQRSAAEYLRPHEALEARLENARAEISKESTGQETTLNQIGQEERAFSEEADNQAAKRPVGRELKSLTFAKEIKHIRRQLSKTDRLGSHIIHQPVIRAVSEASSKTITRPSGLLGGGLAAFLGTGAYLYLTKTIGLRYNYSVFLFLLIGGFILGLIVEGLLSRFHNRRSA